MKIDALRVWKANPKEVSFRLIEEDGEILILAYNLETGISNGIGNFWIGENGKIKLSLKNGIDSNVFDTDYEAGPIKIV